MEKEEQLQDSHSGSLSRWCQGCNMKHTREKQSVILFVCLFLMESVVGRGGEGGEFTLGHGKSEAPVNIQVKICDRELDAQIRMVLDSTIGTQYRFVEGRKKGWKEERKERREGGKKG